MLGAPPKIAAGIRAHPRARGGCERGEECPLILGGALGTQPELAAEHGPVAVGQQRIVAGNGGEQTLGETADPQPIEIDAERHPHRPDEHPLTEPTHAVTRGIELELERAPEDVDGRCRIDRIERAEPVEDGSRPVAPRPARTAATKRAAPRRRDSGTRAHART